MSATQKFFRFLFGQGGDRAAVPDPIQGDGSMSYQEGYGPPYQLAKTDPTSRNIERSKMNQVLYDLTLGCQQYQLRGVPEWVPAADNGGVAVSYPKGALAFYVTDGNYYRSLKAANVSLPTVAADWARIGSTAALKVITNALSPYTLTGDDVGVVLVDATAGAVVINMPSIAANPYARYELRRVDTTANAVTVNRNGADTFDGGATSFTLVGAYANRDLQSNSVSVWRSPMLYESGSFVPVARGTGVAGVFTYTLQVGTYTRVGNRVFFEINISWSASTGTGSLRVGSLPYNVGSTMGFACALRYDAMLVGAGKELTAHITSAANEVILQACDPAGGVATDVPVDAVIGNLMLSGSYIVA